MIALARNTFAAEPCRSVSTIATLVGACTARRPSRMAIEMVSGDGTAVHS